MDTEPKSVTLIAAIKERLRDGGAGTIRVWGADVVRPSDQIYEVKDASVRGGVLRVVLLLALDGKERVVEVVEPSGVKVTGVALRVQKASTVRVFGSEYKPPRGEAGLALYLGV